MRTKVQVMVAATAVLLGVGPVPGFGQAEIGRAHV